TVTAGRLYGTTQLPVVTQILKDLCGQGLVSRVSKMDLESEDIGAWVDEYLPGNNISGRNKNKFLNVVSDLTYSSLAARVGLFETVNSTPPPAIRQQVFLSYDPDPQVQNLSRYLDLDFNFDE